LFCSTGEKAIFRVLLWLCIIRQDMHYARSLYISVRLRDRG